MTEPDVLTIGHSNHLIPAFLDLLVGHGVTAVADVRSAPYSRFSSHFNRQALSESLLSCGIRYVFLGRELGGRSDDPTCYECGRIQYDRLARKDQFKTGLQRVVQGAADFRIALMCAEKEPLDCHRTLLVAQELDRRGVAINHILADGSLEAHANSMARLLEFHDLTMRDDLFGGNGSHEELVDEAIRRQSRRVGHAMSPVTLQHQGARK